MKWTLLILGTLVAAGLMTGSAAAQSAPVFDPKGDTTIIEGQLLELTVSATDADLTTPTISAENLPVANASFGDNGDGSGTLTFTPDYLQSGSYPVTFIASDGALADTIVVTVTVTDAGNQLPVLATIGSQSVDEGQTLSFPVSATDAESTPTLSTSALPPNASFTPNGDGTGSFSFTPDFTQAGPYDITFTATDDSSATDFEVVTITVNNVNQAPVFDPKNDTTVAEGQTLNLTVSATDADLTTPTISAENLPVANASFGDNGDGSGTLTFTPDYLQSGSYPVTFIASDGADADTLIVTVTVTDAGNQAPVLATIGSQSVDEGQLLSFPVSATDAESTPTLTTSALPPNASFTPNGDGTGSFSFTPDFTQAGPYDITFTATDDSLATDFEVVTITVNNVNQAPVFDPKNDTTVAEGQTLNLTVSATDADGTTPALSVVSPPTNASFLDNGDGTGTLTFSPDFTQAASYPITFVASDGIDDDSLTVTVTVTNVNRAPVFDPKNDTTIAEGQTLNLTVSATDPDGTTPSLSVVNPPTNASFLDNGDGTGTLTFSPDFTQAGVVPVTFVADDGSLDDSLTVTITVTETNQSPIFAASGDTSIVEGTTLALTVSASDPDGTTPTLTAENLPATNASFGDNGDGSGTLTFTPDYVQSGSYPVTFIASDGSAADTLIVTVTVTDAGNQPPVLASIGSQSIDEGQTLSFPVSATDAESTPTLSTSTLPPNASFTPNGDGTGSFSFTPDFTQSGPYDITFTATDDSLATDFEVVTITVNNVNQAPVFDPKNDTTITEGQTLNLTVSATDADGTTPTFSAENLPVANASFGDNGDGSGTLTFTPDYLQSGSYPVTFIASDGDLADTIVVTVTVTDAGNQPPVLATIGSQSVDEGQTLSFPVSATDAESTPTLSTSALPPNASFTPNGDGTGSFSFTPDFTQSGPYDITFTATDDSLATDFEVVTITVNNVNQAPVFAAQADTTITEQQTLNLTVSATDADLTTPAISAENLPATNASFGDNGDGTGTLTFTPSYFQSGSYPIRFIASDGADADTLIVAVNVTDAGNQLPVLASIGSQSIAEGQTLNFSVSATDVESTPTLTTSTLPPNATFNDLGGGSGDFSFTPDFTQSGTFNITFRAIDDSLAVDSEIVAITVTNVNLAPTFSPHGDTTIAEAQALTLTVSATDPDGTTPSLSAFDVPSNAGFTDNGDGSGGLNFTPDFTQSGSYAVSFVASDGQDADTMVVTIVVTNTNRDPVLAAIGNQNVDEGQVLNLPISASDPDGQVPSLTTSVLPTNAGFTDNGDGTGSFAFSPDFTQSGDFPVTFYATDPELAVDSEVVIITVNQVNLAPVLDSIGPKSVTEGQLLTFTVTASDADGTIPSLSATGVPLNASFTDNGDGSGSFDFTPEFVQAGTYDVTFTATDDSLATDFEVVTITVNEAGNQTPILSAIGSQSVPEGATLAFGVSAVDPDSTIPALSTSTLPNNASFADNGDGTGSFSFSPGYQQSGVYSVTFYADDGLAVDSEVVSISVTEAGNQAPVLATIGSRSVTEGNLLSFGVSATDPDGTTPSLTTSTLPSNASFVDNGNGTGSFSFSPDFTQAGPYNVTFYASDGVLVDSEQVAITVNDAGNQAPILAEIGPQVITEGQLLAFTVSATDADAEIPTLTTSTLPVNASFVDNGDGTGDFSFTPGYVQSGIVSVTFRASDGVASDSEIVFITINDAGNQPPVLDSIGSRSVTEGSSLAFTVTSSDPEGGSLSLSTSALPANASFIDYGDGTGDFTFDPTLLQAGSYDVTFTVTDDSSATDFETVTITVNEVGNQLPVLDSIGSQTVDENQVLTFAVSASDIEDPSPALSTSTLPANASFVDNGDGTGDFSFSPDFFQSGGYDITFYATDDSLAVDSEVVSVTVNNINRDPVLDPIGAQAVNENDTLSLIITASDPDLNTPVLTTSALPLNASFVDNGDGSGSFEFTPTFDQSGTYDITFYASDGTAVDSEAVTITVNNVNRAPTLDPIGNQFVFEGANLNLALTGSDPDGQALSYSAVPVPPNATFTDNGDNTATFDFNPDYTQSDIISIRFIVTDGVLSDTELVFITIEEAGNQPPVLDPIGAQSVTEGNSLNLAISASDPEKVPPVLTTSALPSNASFVDNGDGTGDFAFNPDFTQSGTYDITFYATDDSTAVDSEVVTITVNESGNQAPVFDPENDTSIVEGTTLNLTVSASDPDATTPALSAVGLPANAGFVDNTDGTGTLTFSPDFTQAATYPITFIASDGTLEDTLVVTVTVTEAGNQRPAFDPQNDTSFVEGTTLSLTVSASDPDATTPSLSAPGLPANASFTDAGTGSGTLTFAADFTQAGAYPITFVASDGSLDDTLVVTVTVTEAGNQSPVFDPQSDTSVTEGATLNLIVSASDPDATIPTLTAENVPANATFNDNGDGTGTLAFSPDFTQAGAYPVRFIASDGAANDTLNVTVTVVESGNQAPVFAPQNDTSFVEGTTLNLTVSASDPDATTPSLSATGIPANASFGDNGDGSGTLTFSPDFTQAGNYPITFIATDGALADTLIVTVTVNDAGNQAPVFDPQGDTSFVEGTTLNLTVSATDADGTTPSLSTGSLPANASFGDNGDGSGTFTFAADFTQAGIYPVTFVASDGSANDTLVVNVTVTEAGNQSPVIAPVNDTTIGEGQSLNILVTATDPDATTPSLSALNVPANASFVDNGNGTGDFDFTPSFVQAGIYAVTFIATDGALSDTTISTITVVEAGNQPPVFAPRSDTTIDEGQSLTYDVFATDADGTTPGLSAVGVPTNASFVDNGDGSGTFSFTPDFTQAGSYPVTFIASDGLLVDTLIVSTVVNDAGNQRPVFSPQADTSVVEGASLNLTVSATDPDATVPSLTAANVPVNANFVDNGDGSGSLVFNPDFSQAGIYPITFIASDGLLDDTLIVNVTVVDGGNQTPVFDPHSDTSIVEGASVTFTVSASDPDSTIPSLSAQGVPVNGSFVDNADGTGTLTFSPDFTQAGVYPISFIATDGSLSDTLVVTVTVTEAGNQRPAFEPVADTTTVENVLVEVTVTATDPDSTIPVLTAVNLPVNASFVDNLDGTGTMSFLPSYIQAGAYTITYIATDGSLSDTTRATVTVIEAGNQAPVLATIGDRSVAEGSVLSFNVSATDPDGTTPSLSTSSLPANAGFVDNGNGTGSFSFSPDFTQAGSYDVTFYASDGALLDSEVVVITVTDAGNQPPVLAEIGPQVVTEGQSLAFQVSASDADGEIPSLTAANLPVNATFTDNGDGTGDFSFSPNYVQSGIRAVTFRASDGVASDSEVVFITINDAGNQPPVLDSIGAQSVTEGSSLAFTVTSSDPEGGLLTLSTTSLPPNANFVDNGDGTGDFTFDPDYLQSGSFDITFTVTDDSLATDNEVVTITVLEGGNQPPVLDSIGAQSVDENQVLNIVVSASDIEDPSPALTTSTLPTNASFVDNGDGTGSFTFSPDFFQAGPYDVTFYATDDSLAVDSEVVTITVNNVNRDPVLDPIGAQAVNENDTLAFVVTASDPDLTTPALTTSTLPANASFVDNGDGSGSFEFIPSFDQSGSYDITFYATDGTASDSEVVTVTVNNVNRAPILDPIGSQFVFEGANLNLLLTGSDPDGQAVSYSAVSIPPNATFIDNGDNTATFDFNPDYTQSDIISVRFIVTDGVLSDSELVFITVEEAGNQPPVLDSIGPKSVIEGDSLGFAVSASDPEKAPPVLTTSVLPANASFADNGDGTGEFAFTPDFTQSGSYDITFYATDDSTAVDSEVVTITVNESGNQAPVFDPENDTSFVEGTTLNLTVSASDPDATTPALSAAGLPANAGFVDNTDGTGTLTFSPDFTQAGAYPITFIASDGTLADTLVVTVTVTEAGNQRPTFAPQSDTSFVEGTTLNLTVSASDPDATTPALSAVGLPANASFVDNTDGTGTLTFSPTFAQAGAYPITFVASDGSLADTLIVTVTVIDAGNQRPALDPIADTSTTENVLVEVTISAADPDSTIPALSASNLPPNASFVDNLDGTGTMSFLPDFTQAGVYAITYIASDGSLSDTVVASVTVIEAGNQAPVLDSIGPKSIAENTNLNFNVTASDPDATIPALTAVGVPPNATFTDNNNGSGTFDFTPDFTQEGTYNVTFIASDGTLADSELVVITVTGSNRAPIADAGIDQFDVLQGAIVTLDGTGSSDPDGDALTYSWIQIGGSPISLSDPADSLPTFQPLVVDVYEFELTVSDGLQSSTPDTVAVTVVSSAPPQAVSDLSIQIVGESLQLSWSPVTLDTTGLSATIDRYVVYRSTSAYFTPTPADSIGVTDAVTFSFLDSDIGGANVVGDTLTQYFYTIVAVDYLEKRSDFSNRVGEYDYQIVTTTQTDFNLIGVPFTNTGITDAASLINAIGIGLVNTVNNYIPSSQSWEARFAAGFGPNFAVAAGGIYQVNAKASGVFSVAGNVPAPGSVTYQIVTTATTDFSFLMIPFEEEGNYLVAQDVLDALPGVLNTLNNYVAGSQSYVSRFAAGFGTNFAVRGGKPYQANAATDGVFPAP